MLRIPITKNRVNPIRGEERDGSSKSVNEVHCRCLSHGFEAEADASGMFKLGRFPHVKRHTLSGIKGESRNDGLSEDGEGTRRELGTGRVVCPSAEDNRVNEEEGSVGCKLGTGGVVCPNAKRNESISRKLGTSGVVCPNAIKKGKYPQTGSWNVGYFMTILMIMMMVNGCHTKDDFTWHNSGWANWFDDPLAAWQNGEAFKLMHQEEFPDLDWDQYQPPDPMDIDEEKWELPVSKDWLDAGDGEPLNYDQKNGHVYSDDGDWAWESYPMGQSYYEEEQDRWGTSSAEQPWNEGHVEGFPSTITAEVGGMVTSLALLFANPLRRLIGRSRRRRINFLCVGLIILAISASQSKAVEIEEVIDNKTLPLEENDTQISIFQTLAGGAQSVQALVEDYGTAFLRTIMVLTHGPQALEPGFGRRPPMSEPKSDNQKELEELREAMGNIAQSYEELALRVAVTEEIQQEDEVEVPKEPEEEQSSAPQEDIPRKQEQSQENVSKVKKNGERVVELLKAAGWFRQLEKKLKEEAEIASSSGAENATEVVPPTNEEKGNGTYSCQTIKCLTKGAVDLLLESSFSVFGNPIQASKDGAKWVKDFLKEQAETLSQIFGTFLFLMFLNIVFYVYIKGAQVYKKMKEVVKIILGLPLVMVVQQLLSEVLGFFLQLKKEKKDKGKLEKEIKKLGDGVGLLFEEIQRNRQENLNASKEIEERFRKSQERNMDVYRGVRDDLRRFQEGGKLAGQGASSSQEKGSSIKCDFCGRYGHHQDNCRLRLARRKESEKVKASGSSEGKNRCWFCGKEGHLMANCPKNRSTSRRAEPWGKGLSRINEVQEGGKDESSHGAGVNSIEKEKPKELMHTPIWINGIRFERCLVDPGSQTNLIPLREMTRSGIPFVSEVNWVRAYDNTIGKTMGRFTSSLKIGSIKGENVEFLVSDNIDLPFVGLQTLGDMGFNIRCKDHELHHEESGEIVRCTAISMTNLEKGKN